MAVSGDSVLVRSVIATNITRVWQKNGFLGPKNVTEVGFYTVGRLEKKGRVGVRAALQVGLEDVKKLEGNFGFDVVSEGGAEGERVFRYEEDEAGVHHRACVLLG
ncbi:hypothetical protein SLE2022_206050 [Rubroshorea leprosula]